jgi:hypoxanthine phosphoribosyltransferase
MMMDDIERVMFTKENIAGMIAKLGKEISRDYAGKEIFAVGILKGAVVFFSDVVRAIDVPVQMDFMIASSYGNSAETSGTVKILKDLDYDIAGKHVMIIEDIIDSGLTMEYLMEILRARKPASIRLCALLSKPSRRQTDVTIDYCGAEVPDEFLVGYGLDFAEKYRNLPCIGILKKEIYA